VDHGYCNGTGGLQIPVKRKAGAVAEAPDVFVFNFQATSGRDQRGMHGYHQSRSNRDPVVPGKQRIPDKRTMTFDCQQPTFRIKT
jgi:hypothetical protein